MKLMIVTKYFLWFGLGLIMALPAHAETTSPDGDSHLYSNANLVILTSARSDRANSKSSKSSSAQSSRSSRMSRSKALRQIFKLTNNERAQKGLPPLKKDSRGCNSAAQKHATWLSNNNSPYRPHHNFEQRVASFSGRKRVSENVAFTSDGINPEKAVRLWMRSTKHRREILRGSNRSIGIGLAVDKKTGRAFYTQCFVGSW